MTGGSKIEQKLRRELSMIDRIFTRGYAASWLGVCLLGSLCPAHALESKGDPIKQAARVILPAEVGVGRFVVDAAFTDLAGNDGRLSDFKSKKLLVVAFTSTTCPLCKKYAPTLARLEKEYAHQDVAFLFVNPIATDEPAGHAFAGRYVHDKGGKLLAVLGATATTEIFVLDPARTLIYRGAIDDQYGLGYALDAARNHYLADALNAALTGARPKIAATEAPGCSLEPDPGKAPAVTLTYHARVERIVQANCAECHRKAGVAPFALGTYEQVVAHKGMIKKVVNNGTMPPWFAARPAPGDRSPWINDRSLSAADKADLLAWLGGGLNKGDAADAPRPRTFEPEWQIGRPDAVFQLPKPIAIKAEGTMPYTGAAVETTLEEDKWVQAIEVQPTAREVVHHVVVYEIVKEQQKSGGGGKGYFTIYVPGNGSVIYPDGFAKKLAKGTTLVFQMHYTPNGKATTDQTRIGLVFARQPPRHEVFTKDMKNQRFKIPAGADNHEIEAKLPLPENATLLSLFPHAHLRGKASRFELEQSDKTRTRLLDVPHYDFNWQLSYRYANPVSVPNGSSLVYTAWYDNSAKNPANPDPTKDVRWGEQTTNEMHFATVEYYISP
jgi:thiol-disulfide isomerase/thioredoxin